jgi:Tfp pilus assembly protein PilF
MFGLKPGGHHAVNLVLHALNSALVFLVLRQLTGAFWRSVAVAAFFAWHPLHVEPAAWIVQRNGLLCAFFWLLSLWAYVCYAQNLKSQISNLKFHYAAAVVLFALALMSAPVAVTLPVLLLLLDWWPLGRWAATPERPAAKQTVFLLVEKIPFLVLSIAACVMNTLAVHGNQILDPIARLPFRIRFVTAGLSCFRYLCKSFWPSDLGALYPFVMHPPKLQLIGVALALIVVSMVAVRVRKTRPYWLAGWLWFLAALFPALNLAQTGAQPMADRYMYIPSIGLWMLICWEAHDLAAAPRFARAALGGLCVLLLAACCALSWRQLGIWRNEGTLLARIPQSEANPFGHADDAAYLLQQGQLVQARTECEKAISIVPNNPKVQVLLGDILLGGHNIDEAIKRYQSALRLDHTFETARLELGRAFLAQNRPADAAEEFRTVLHNQPRNFEAHNLLARICLMQGRAAVAVAEYRASLSLQNNQLDTLNNLAWLLATDPHPEIRHGAEAVQLARRACWLTKNQEPVFLGTLAAALAETGDFDKAVETGKRAHDQAQAQGRKALAEANLQMVDLYRAHKPFREKPRP